MPVVGAFDRELARGAVVERLEEPPFTIGSPSLKDRLRVVVRLREPLSDLPERTVAPLGPEEPRGEKDRQREPPVDIVERPREPVFPAEFGRAVAALPDLAPEVVAVLDLVEGPGVRPLPLRTAVPLGPPEVVPPNRRHEVPEPRSVVERVGVTGDAPAPERAAEERLGPVVVEPCTAPGVADNPVRPARDRAVALGKPAAPRCVDAAEAPRAGEVAVALDRGWETMAEGVPPEPRPRLAPDWPTVPGVAPERRPEAARVASGFASAKARTDRVTLSRCCPKLVRCTRWRDRLFVKNFRESDPPAALAEARRTTLPRLCDSGITGTWPRITDALRSSPLAKDRCPPP